MIIILHSTLGECEEISDCSYNGQTLRNIKNVSQFDQRTPANEDSELHNSGDCQCF